MNTPVVLGRHRFQRPGWQLYSADCGRCVMWLIYPVPPISVSVALTSGPAVPGGTQTAAVV